MSSEASKPTRIRLRHRALEFLDGWLHELHVPKRFWWQLCDAYDISAGVPDTPENFPRRHGFYRLTHTASGNGSYWSERLRCQHCQREMSDWDKPCVLVPIPPGLKATR